VIICTFRWEEVMADGDENRKHLYNFLSERFWHGASGPYRLGLYNALYFLPLLVLKPIGIWKSFH
jgi:hypothetical protein